MTVVIYILVRFVYYLVLALQLCMFARAVLSWVMPDEDNSFTRLLYSVTDPLIYPVRAIIERIPSLRDMPFDISFMITFILLIILQSIIQVSL